MKLSGGYRVWMALRLRSSHRRLFCLNSDLADLTDLQDGAFAQQDAGNPTHPFPPQQSRPDALLHSDVSVSERTGIMEKAQRSVGNPAHPNNSLNPSSDS